MRCMLTRWAISKAADGGGEIPERRRDHIEGCADCTAFERRLEWLGRSLTVAADGAPPPEQPDRFPRHLTATGLVAAGAIAVVLVVGSGNSPAPIHQPVVAESHTPAAEPERIDIDSLTTDAESGIRYMLRVSGLPEP